MISTQHLHGRINLRDVVLPDLGIDVVSIRGNELTVRCPDLTGAHTNGDRSPSMRVNEDKLKYNCNVCGGGSLLNLVEDVLGLSEDDALAWLEEHSNLAPSEAVDFKNEVERILARHREAVEPMPEYPKDLLFQYEGYHLWLADRGISRETATEMQIGFDDAHCGIVIPHFFRRKLVGIQVRHLAENNAGAFLCPEGCYQTKTAAQYRGTGVPKYKNTPNFPRSSTLYNYDLARQESDWVIVVESPMSVLYLMTYGIRNVVATFGSGLSSTQAQLLFVFMGGVFLWADNDPAGNKTIRDSLVILRDFVPTKLVPLVPGKKSDPADVPPELLRDYLSAAYPAVLFEMEGLREWAS